MKQTILSFPEILGACEDMNEELFQEYNSIRVWIGSEEIKNPDNLKIIIYNDENQNIEPKGKNEDN